jgi:hypothetical protein
MILLRRCLASNEPMQQEAILGIALWLMVIAFYHNHHTVAVQRYRLPERGFFDKDGRFSGLPRSNEVSTESPLNKHHFSHCRNEAVLVAVLSKPKQQKQTIHTIPVTRGVMTTGRNYLETVTAHYLLGHKDVDHNGGLRSRPQ